MTVSGGPAGRSSAWAWGQSVQCELRPNRNVKGRRGGCSSLPSRMPSKSTRSPSMASTLCPLGTLACILPEQVLPSSPSRSQVRTTWLDALRGGVLDRYGPGFPNRVVPVCEHGGDGISVSTTKSSPEICPDWSLLPGQLTVDPRFPADPNLLEWPSNIAKDARSSCCSGDQLDTGGSSEANRLIARCMTHERPAALVQANAAVLDTCLVMLGEEADASERRSDKIRKMLRLTDELRRYNADLQLPASTMSRISSPDEVKSSSSSTQSFLRDNA